MIIRIATRASDLALAQAHAVAGVLKNAAPDTVTEIVPLSTRGDRDRKSHLAAIGGKGVFVREVEAALRDGRADIAVHSLKDVPAREPEDLFLAAFLPRACPHDRLLTRDGRTLDRLAPGSIVGTCSPRRVLQLSRHRPDLVYQPLRGNVPTRAARVTEGDLDATILAAAGLERLKMTDLPVVELPPEISLPAGGQGIIAIQCARAANPEMLNLLASISHAETATAAHAERIFLQHLDGSCRSPIGAFARPVGDQWQFNGWLAGMEGDPWLEETATATEDEIVQAAADCALRILDRGGQELLDAQRAEHGTGI